MVKSFFRGFAGWSLQILLLAALAFIAGKMAATDGFGLSLIDGTGPIADK